MIRGICLIDLEGTLSHEFWEIVSEKLKIPELRKTTREIPNFKKLVKYRLKILKENNIKINKLISIAESVPIIEGAKEFLEELNKLCDIIIVSGIFYEFGTKIVKKLGNYTLIANLLFNDEGKINPKIIIDEKGKAKIARFFKEMGYYTIGIGDSLNDLKMLEEVCLPILFRPSEETLKMIKNEEIIITKNYNEIIKIIEKRL